MDQHSVMNLDVEPAADASQEIHASNTKRAKIHAVLGSRHKGQAWLSRIISKTPRLLLLPLGTVAALVPLLAIILPVVFKLKEMDDNSLLPSYCAGPGINGSISSTGLDVDVTGVDATACVNETVPGITVTTKVSTLDVAAGSMTITVNIFPSGSLEAYSSSNIHFSKYDAFQMAVVELEPGQELQVIISRKVYTFQAGDIFQRIAVELWDSFDHAKTALSVMRLQVKADRNNTVRLKNPVLINWLPDSNVPQFDFVKGNSLDPINPSGASSGGVREVGGVTDMTGFFWNMAMISGAVLLLLCAFVGQHKSEES
eukprot:gene4138-4387_t